ncbi:MAG TPA: hypothetical protein VN257_05785 [Actinotalea sp.]|nr:hypothetical protein [Actinotalea sp.]
MSTVLHPVGPQPPRVYWIRRTAVLIALALVGLVIGVLWWAVFGRGDTAAEDAPAAQTEAAAEQPTGEAQEVAAEPSGPVACAAADLAVTLTADGRSYPAGTAPTFALAVTNNGSSSCTLDGGEANREVLVTSGSDRIWSSLDCLADPVEQLQLLESGGRFEATVAWPRVRSAQGCPADLAEPRPGTYTAVATVLGASSAAAVVELG